MNIQRLKKLINLFLFISFFTIVISCKTQEHISEIFTGIKIDTSYVYSKSSRFELEDNIYSLRQKAIYNLEGELERIIAYKYEGVVEYNKNELLKDPKIVEYYGFPFKQNWFYRKDNLIINNKNMIKVLKIKNILLKTDKNNITTFYKIKN